MFKAIREYGKDLFSTGGGGKNYNFSKLIIDVHCILFFQNDDRGIGITDNKSIPHLLFDKRRYGTVPNPIIFKQVDFFVLFKFHLHLPPLRFHCDRGFWDRTQECCDFGIDPYENTKLPT
jgi:hypothetical protein